MEGADSSRRERILSLQILRFIAAAGVLLSHAADLTLSPSSAFWSFPWTAGVDVFFVISGVIMTILADGQFGAVGAARRFVTRRIIRIVPIYWLFTALMIATIVLFPANVRNSQADPPSIVTSLLFVPWPRGDGQVVPILAQGWTLNYEAFFYAAFALALLHRRGLPFLIAGFAALALCHPLVPQTAVAPHFWSDPIILEFLAGIGLAKAWLSGFRLRPGVAALLGASAVLLFAATALFGLAELGRPAARGIPAALLVAAFLFADRGATLGRLRRAAVAVGDASYALYLSHTFVINAVLLLIGDSLSGWSVMGLASVAAVVAALFVHYLVERPMLTAFRRRFNALPPLCHTSTARQKNRLIH